MKKYKIQAAYSIKINKPSIHSDEVSARGEVAHLLGTWIRRGLQQYLESLSDPNFNRYPELEEGIRQFLPELRRLMGEGKVWEAYELWEDFYIHFENVTGTPLYILTGSVIVEGSPGTGLKNRLPLMEPEDRPVDRYKGRFIAVNTMDRRRAQLVKELIPVIINKASIKNIEITEGMFLEAIYLTDMAISGKYSLMDEEAEDQYFAELREGTLRRLFPKLSGLGLGAFQSWQVQYADFGGALHPGLHTNEELAKAQAGEYLTVLMSHLERHSDSEAGTGRNQDYVIEAEVLIRHIEYMIDMGYVWVAYLDYKAFERKWNNEFAPFPLEMAIGTMRVIPEPEPEPML